MKQEKDRKVEKCKLEKLMRDGLAAEGNKLLAVLAVSEETEALLEKSVYLEEQVYYSHVGKLVTLTSPIHGRGQHSRGFEICFVK